MGKYILSCDIEILKLNLGNIKTDVDKLHFLNFDMKETKRMIEELKSTKVAEGYENGCWSIFTQDEHLSDLLVNELETHRKIFKVSITDVIIQQTIEGLKNSLTEYYISMESEYDFIKRGNDIDQEIVENQKTMKPLPGSEPYQFQTIANDLQSIINVWYNSDIKIKTKLANEIDLKYSDQEEEIKIKYSKIDFFRLIFSFLDLKEADKNWTAKQLYNIIKK